MLDAAFGLDSTVVGVPNEFARRAKFAQGNKDSFLVVFRIFSKNATFQTQVINFGLRSEAISKGNFPLCTNCLDTQLSAQYTHNFEKQVPTDTLPGPLPITFIFRPILAQHGHHTALLRHGEVWLAHRMVLS